MDFCFNPHQPVKAGASLKAAAENCPSTQVSILTSPLRLVLRHISFDYYPDGKAFQSSPAR